MLKLLAKGLVAGAGFAAASFVVYDVICKMTIGKSYADLLKDGCELANMYKK